MLDALPSPKVQYVKYITDTAHAGCRKIFEEKKAALKSGDQEALLKVGEGKDVMSVLRASFSHSVRISETANLVLSQGERDGVGCGQAP